MALLNGGTIGLKWRKSFSFQSLFTNVYMYGVGELSSDEPGWKPGLLIFSSSVIFPHYMAFVWGWLEGAKRDKI